MKTFEELTVADLEGLSKEQMERVIEESKRETVRRKTLIIYTDENGHTIIKR